MQDTQSQLIGRKEELGVLLQWLQTGRKQSKRPYQEGFFSQGADFSHTMLLQGEAGIGKTRLAQVTALLAGELGWEVVWSQDKRNPQQEDTSYCIWRDLLRGIKWSNRVPNFLREKYSTYRPLAAFLPELFGWLAWKERLEPTTSQIFEAVFGYLVEMSFRHPLLLVIEDIHQVDEPSLNLLAYVIRRLRYEHVLVLLTSRDSTSGNPLWALQRQLLIERVLSQLTICPLTKEQIGQFVLSAVGDKQQAWTQFLQRWAGGNPRFALDLLSLLKSGLLTGENTHRDALWLPTNATDTLEAHLKKVSPQARKLLRQIVTLGTPCPLPLLLSSMVEGRSGIRDEDRLFELLDEVYKEGLLLEEMTQERSGIHYRFRHPLLGVYLSQ